MKQLEITTNKRLLIVEGVPDEIKPITGREYLVTEDTKHLFYLPVGTFKYLCKGDDLSKVADSLSILIQENSHLSYYVDHTNKSGCGYYTNAMQSFISAIESKNYHWGENPVSLEREKIYRNMGDTFKADGILKAWREAESRTFNPSKCIIFEIL